MIKHVDSGGWYGDVNLNGTRVSLHRDSHIVVGRFGIDTEIIELPVGAFGKENLIQMVFCVFNDQILIAGQGGAIGQNTGSGNWLYEDGGWRVISPSFGTFACCFDPSTLYLVVGQNQYRTYNLFSREFSPVTSKQLGAQGIRYIDFNQASDGIITSDATYGPKPYNLAQWILRTDIVLGQSYIDGCIASVLGDENYKVEPGDCQFLRFYRRGKDLAIAIVKMPENSTVFYWLNANEIKSFPVDSGEVTPIPPIPPEEPVAPNEIETVKKVLREHPEIDVLDDVSRGDILNFVIEDLDGSPWGRKSRNSSGTDLNTDVLGYKFSDGKIEWIDVLLGHDPNPSNPDRGKYATWSTDHKKWNNGENGFWVEGGDVVPGPEPGPEPGNPVVVNKDDVRNGSNEIIRFYNEPDGLNRAARGIPSPIDVHDQACWDWVAFYTTKLAEGKTPEQAMKEVKDTIKTFPEYIEQHP